jgi:hypothetical protein
VAARQHRGAELTMRPGEGHFGFIEHTAEMLTAPTGI